MIHIAKVFSSLKSGSVFLNAGAIRDGLVGEKELARYFLGILNFSEEYKKWAKFSINENDGERSNGPELEMKRKRVYPTDHTQVTFLLLCM